MKKALAGVLLLSGITLAGCADETVASSTAGKISQEDIYEEMKAAGVPQVLQQMHLEDVLEDDYGDTVSEEDVQAAFDAEVERFGGEAGLEYALMSENLTAEQYKENIHLNLLVEQAVLAATEFSEEEIEQAYEEYQPAVTAQHILVPEEEQAQKLIQELNDGADFSELAQEHSQDPGTAAQGGEITFTTGEMVPEFEEAAFALEEGEMTSEPVQTDYGYHIIQMNEKPEKGSLEEERDTIEEMLVEERMTDSQYVLSVLSDIVQESNIIINDDDLTDAMEAYMPLPEVDESEQTDPAGEADTSEPAETEDEQTDTSEEGTDTSEE